MKTKPQKFLGNLTPQEFLNNYWEQKILVVRNAIDNASTYISPELMREMAAEEEIESRLLYTDHHGIHLLPQATPQVIDENKNKAWTLINHGTELFHKPLYRLRQLTNFIPQWNFDDIMVSYSMPQGSVGPHIDSYNVFIIQGRGKKRWLLNPHPDPELIPSTEIKILANFQATEEYILEEGDMLYLPPGVAHYGIALTEGLSYSIGFNSFKRNHFLHHCLKELIEDANEDELEPLPFTDQHNYFQLTPFLLDSLTQQIQNRVATITPHYITHHLSKYLTTPRYWPTPNTPLSFDEFLSCLEKHEVYRDPYVRLLQSNNQLYINQVKYQLHPSEIEQLITLLNSFPMEPLHIPKISFDSYRVLFHLYLRGEIYLGNKI